MLGDAPKLVDGALVWDPNKGVEEGAPCVCPKDGVESVFGNGEEPVGFPLVPKLNADPWNDITVFVM